MQHGSSKPTGPAVPEPTHAERARTLVRQGGPSSLSTMSARRRGYPFGSVMPFADQDGAPLFLISTMAMHTQNLQADGKATLLITAGGDDLLGAGRVSLMGDAVRVSDQQRPAARECYLESQPAAKQWIDFDDFQLWILQVVDVYFVGGFGVMGWVEAADYLAAAPDPLLESAAGIIEHMNADHAEALVLLCHAAGYEEAREAKMTTVDRLGYHVRMNTDQGPRGARIAFPREVNSSNECRTTFVEMVKSARGEPTA